MKKLFFILIFAVTANVMALPDNPLSITTSDNYKSSDAKITYFIFNEIRFRNEKPGDIDYIYEQYKLASRQHWIQAQTQAEYALIDDQLYADYLLEAYNQSKSPADKKELDAHVAKIKTSYKIDYKPMPLKNQFAKIDLDRKVYVLNGVTYDINDKVIPTKSDSKPANPPKVVKTPRADKTEQAKAPATKKKAVIIVGPLSEPEILPDAAPFARCVWDKNNPRSVVYGPGCNADGSCLCRGHVICERNGLQKRRLATCSEKYCTDETPSECSAELGFGSQIPQN